MTSIDPNELFFNNSLDGSSKLLELDQFLEYVSHFLSKESKYFEEEAHQDIAREFLPLFADTLPPVLYSSIVISTATLLEQEMRGYAAALLNALPSEIKFGDLAGSVLERFRIVTTKIANLEFNDAQSFWQDIVGLFEIRNCLVHSGGDLAAFQKSPMIRAFSQKHGTPDVSHGRLKLDVRTSEIALQIASTFLDSIYDMALQKFPGRNAPRHRKS